MGIFSKIFGKKAEKTEIEEELSLEMADLSQLSAEKKRKNNERKRIQREIENTREMIRLEEEKLKLEEIKDKLAEIREQYEEYEEEEEENPAFNAETLLLSILTGAQQKGLNNMPPQTAPIQAAPPVQEPKFTDEQMKQGLTKLFNKQQLEVLKNMDEADLLQAHRLSKGL